MAARGATDFDTRWRQVRFVAIPVAVVLATFALLWVADEAHYRSCLAQADLKYPAVPVSAFVESSRTNTGPLKVSYAQQRIDAANACHHL